MNSTITVQPTWFMCSIDFLGIDNIVRIFIAIIGLLAYRFHILTNKRKYYFEAFMTFSKNFNSSLYLINQDSATSYYIIYAEFQKHFVAMLDFIHILEDDRRTLFKVKWNEYENCCKAIKAHGKSIAFDEKDNFPEKFMLADDPKELEKDNNNKKELERLINELLAIAKKN